MSYLRDDLPPPFLIMDAKERSSRCQRESFGLESAARYWIC
jgi:hypothetical protein